MRHPDYDNCDCPDTLTHRDAVRKADIGPNDVVFTTKELVSWSQVRRLKVVKGKDWWINENSPPNGIGPVCLFCDLLIDWGPTDHAPKCPVRKYLRFDEEE